jgi:hypothetical protein
MPNAKVDEAVGRQVGVALDEARQDLDRAAHRIDHATEFNQNTIAQCAAMARSSRSMPRPRMREYSLFGRRAGRS